LQLLFYNTDKIGHVTDNFQSFLSQEMKLFVQKLQNWVKIQKRSHEKQQETMKLYNKAGVNPMAGCIPALIQMPFDGSVFHPHLS
jgi:YidC/Oxa1 family membrane protein insertase